MNRILAVVGPTEATKRLLREAGTIAEGTDTDLVVLHVTSDEEYSRRRGAMESVPDTSTSYTPDEAREGAVQFANDIAAEVLSEFDVEYEAVGMLGDTATEVLEAAEARECDHIFLVGQQRSPTGKALFGDAAQRIVLQSGGYVTVLTE